jgi:CRISPR system Cascade subunit CasA
VPGFNLLDQPWIPVRDLQGHLREISLRDALTRAAHWRRIEHASPLAEVALHRLLLAVLHRALGARPRDEWDALAIWEAGEFPVSELGRYFDRYADRFELSHPTHPFYQVGDLPDAEPRPWTVLLPELASGNNPTLFDHSVDDDPRPVGPSEAAIALLVHQSFSPGGLLRRMGVTSVQDALLARVAVFLPLGATLFETLLLNLAPYDPLEADDRPIWEEEPIQADELVGYRLRRPPRGRTRRYSWMTRAVRLLWERDGTVRFIGYGPGVNPGADAALVVEDPMCAYRSDKRAGLQAVRLNLERAFWRDLEALWPGEERIVPQVRTWAHALLMARGTTPPILPLLVSGQVTKPGQDKVLDVRREVYPLPRDLSAATSQEVAWAIGEAEHTAVRLRETVQRLAARLLPADAGGGGRSRLDRMVDGFPLLRLYWSALDAAFPDYLTRLGSGERPRQAWRNQLRDAVDAAWRATAEAVGVGGRHLAALAEAESVIRAVIRALREG